MTDPRVPLVSADTKDPLLSEVFDTFRDKGRDVPALYRTLGNAPKMLKAWTDFAWPLRHDAATPRGLRELIIMRVAQLTQAEFEWIAHWDMAVHHGVTVDHLADLADWKASSRFSAEQRAVLQLTDELTIDSRISDETYAAVAAQFTPSDVVEIVLTAAFYPCVSRVLHAFELGTGLPYDDPRLRLLRDVG